MTSVETNVEMCIFQSNCESNIILILEFPRNMTSPPHLTCIRHTRHRHHILPVSGIHDIDTTSYLYKAYTTSTPHLTWIRRIHDIDTTSYLYQAYTTSIPTSYLDKAYTTSIRKIGKPIFTPSYVYQENMHDISTISYLLKANTSPTHRTCTKRTQHHHILYQYFKYSG